DLVVFEDTGILTDQLPGLEERRPVDIGHEFAQIVRPVLARAEIFWHRRLVIVPVEFFLVGARLLEGEAAAGRAGGGMARRDLFIFLARPGDEFGVLR